MSWASGAPGPSTTRSDGPPPSRSSASPCCSWALRCVICCARSSAKRRVQLTSLVRALYACLCSTVSEGDPLLQFIYFRRAGREDIPVLEVLLREENLS